MLFSSLPQARRRRNNADQSSFLPEFDQEMANTRKLLERVPDGKADYKPHEKSMSLGRLAGHVAELPGWAKNTLETQLLDSSPACSLTSPHRGRNCWISSIRMLPTRGR